MKIKSKGPSNRHKKLSFIGIFATSQIHTTSVFSANEGFAILILDENRAEKIFTKEIKQIK